MAEPGSPSNPVTGTTSNPPTPVDPAALPQHDWELLSMSMSSSAFGTGSASLVCGCAACTGRDSGIPHQFPTGTSHIEPFTGGWKPRLGPAVISIPDQASFDYVAGYNPFQEQYQQGACSTNEDTEPLVGLSRETFMVGEDFVETEGKPDEKSSSDSSTTDAKEIPVTKSRKVQANRPWRAQFRESTTLWSIALAATVVGIVIIGYRWHRENQQLRVKLCAKEEEVVAECR